MTSRDRARAGPAAHSDPAGDPAAADEDARLWRSVTRSVTPLARPAPPESAPESVREFPPKSVPGPPSAADPPAGPAADAQAGTAADTAGRVDISGLRFGVQAPPAAPPRRPGLDYGDAPGVDRRTATRFRRGLMPIAATLDLHGYNRDGGRAALAGFLRAQRSAGRRCVLIVTGKGLKQDWSVGTLRQALPGWLNAPDLRRLILAYCQAQPRHGGSGAVYILLRRERGETGGNGR